ncbi:hypothetical protein CgunFtcFv8_023946 [Champsocephalus gunnari]|uniref:Uncharacterized protein n=1 Tax=Champsocephalus gunnari TaxID=52237 RepID=A0AAN8HLC3_CHAGU|nr:hypothetical protein CgunFtcFv8_023946 [Champsocephalus gunnari]
MAEEILGKTVKELKKARTNAKSNFTRQANYLNREAGRMVEAELREEFTKLKEGLRKVLEANDDCMAGLQADAQKAEGKEEEVLAKREEADGERTAEEAEARMEEVRGLFQDNLWSRYGQYELITAIEEAEEASEQVGNVPVQGTYLEGYGVLLTILEKRMKEATRVMAAWECWIPMMAKSDLAGRVKDLKVMRNRLEMRQGEFVTARRIAAKKLQRFFPEVKPDKLNRPEEVKTPKGTEKAHELVCYGLEEIAKVHKVISPEKLQKFFPEVKPEES